MISMKTHSSNWTDFGVCLRVCQKLNSSHQELLCSDPSTLVSSHINFIIYYPLNPITFWCQNPTIVRKVGNLKIWIRGRFDRFMDSGNRGSYLTPNCRLLGFYGDPCRFLMRKSMRQRPTLSQNETKDKIGWS